MVEKPAPEKAPSDFAIMGRYVLTPEIFELLAEGKPGAGGEIQLTDGLLALDQRAARFTATSSRAYATTWAIGSASSRRKSASA